MEYGTSVKCGGATLVDGRCASTLPGTPERARFRPAATQIQGHAGRGDELDSGRRNM